MKKRRMVKIAACFLLLGSTGLVGCKKKTTGKTTEIITTRDPRKAISFEVFIDDVKYGKDNNTIKFEYNDGYDYLRQLKIIAKYSDKTEEVLDETEFETMTNLTIDSGIGKYVLTIMYEDLTPVNVFLEVDPLVLDFSTTRWNFDEVTYNGLEQEAKLINLPTGIPTDMLTYTDNKRTIVGNYTSKVNIKENTNYSIVNFDDALYSHKWTINKLIVDLTNQEWDYVTPFTYDGKEKEIKLVNLPSGVEVEYSGNKEINAGTYTARATFIQNDNVSITPAYLEKEFVINKKTIDFSTAYWDDLKNYVYNKENQTIELVDIPRLPSDVTISLNNNVKKDAGTYTATLTVNSTDNYEIVGLTDEITSHTWTINKANVKFLEIHAENKEYDGLSSTVSYKTNLDLVPDTFWYKKADEDDSKYAQYTPVDSGAYTVKVVINDTSNYFGASATCNFVIGKKILYVYGNDIEDPNMTISFTQEGVEEAIPLTGFDESLMKFRDGDPDPIQTHMGSFVYHIELKDDAKSNYILRYETDYTWVRNTNEGIGLLMSEIKYNGSYIGYIEFERMKYFNPGDTLSIKLKGSNYGLFINGVNYKDKEFVVPNAKSFNIIADTDTPHYHYYNVKRITNECGINRIKLNDSDYNFNNTNIDYILTSDTLKIDFDICEDRLNYIKVNNQNIDFDNPTITLDNVGSEVIIDYSYIDFEFNTINSQFKINVNKSEYINSFDVLALHLNNNSILSHHLSNSKTIKVSNELIYDVKVNFKDEFRGYTYKIIDSETNELVDFTAIKPKYNLYFEIYNYDMEKVSTFNDFIIQIDDIKLDGFESFTNPETNEVSLYKCSDSNTITITSNETLFKYLDVYVNDEKNSTITYTNEDAYREKITFKKTIYGLEYYSKDLYVDIIYSKKISTYGSIYYSSSDNDIYNGFEDKNNNIFAFNSDGTSKVLGIYDLLNVTIDDFTFIPLSTDYAFKYEMSNIELLDKYSNTLLRFKITLVIHDPNTNAYNTFYAITYFSGSYSSDTKIVGEKTIETFSMDSDYKKDILITSDTLNISNTSPLYSYSFELKNESDVKLSLSGSEEAILDLEGIKKFDLNFSDEGTYILTITAVTGKERIITINVTGDFENVFETQIGDGTLLYIDNKLETNFSSYNVGDMEYLVGFYGNSSSELIDDDQKVSIKVGGSILDFIYKDKDLTTLINNPTDTLDVLYDRYKNPYIELFMKTKYIKIYLTDKPESDVSISIGNETYDLFYMLDYSYYGDLGLIDDNFYVKPDGFSGSLTITVKEIYDDFSYAIIVMDENDSFDNYESYSEMETKQKLFRVKDIDTLTKELTNFDSRKIYILPYGSKDDVYNPKRNAHPLIIDMPIYYFNITIFNDESYYYGYDNEGNELTNSYLYDYENGEFRFKVGKDKGQSTEGKYIEFQFESTYLYNDDLIYRDTDLGRDVKCYDSNTNTFKVKHNLDQGSVIIFFTDDHSRFVMLEFVDRMENI